MKRIEARAWVSQSKVRYGTRIMNRGVSWLPRLAIADRLTRMDESPVDVREDEDQP